MMMTMRGTSALMVAVLSAACSLAGEVEVSSVLGPLPTPAELAAAQEPMRPRRHGEPVERRFDEAARRRLARDYKHVTFLEDSRGRFPAFPLGVTGAWAFDFAGRKEVELALVEEGSPADGRLLPNDIVIGANGLLFRDGHDPRVAMGYALAESHSKPFDGVLTLQVVRAGAPLNVKVPVGVEPEYGPKWPYECPLSAEIAHKALRLILDRAPVDGVTYQLRHGGGSWWNTLFLMASGDDEALERARRDVYHLASGKPSYSCWNTGYESIILGEYYLLTGDSVVLPAVKAWKERLEWGQARSGSWGHGMPCGGYGEVNQVGLACFLGLALARECGMEMDPVALPRSIRFFRKFAGGGIPYGNHPGGPFGRSDNGKNCIAAVAFHILGDEPTARKFARPVCYSFRCRELGHAEGIFAFAWGPLAAALAPEPEFHLFMDNLLWYYELGRLRNGGLHFLRGGHFGSPFGHTGAMGLFLYLPKKKLRITGAPPSVFGLKPPPGLEAAAELFKQKKWRELEAALTGYLQRNTKGPGADYARRLLDAYRRTEAHARATLRLIRQSLASDALKAKLQLDALRKLLGEERPEMAAIRAWLDSPKGQAAMAESTRRHKQRKQTNDTVLLRRDAEAEPPMVWDAVLPLAAQEGSAYRVLRSVAAPPEAWVEPSFDDSGWQAVKGAVRQGSGALWVRRTFSLKSAHYRFLKLLTSNSGVVYLNGYRLVELGAGKGGKKGPREVALGVRAAGALRRGSNVLAARLEGRPADLALLAAPRKPDLAALRRGLAAYWKFDEGRGTTFAATLPSPLEGAVAGKAEWVKGRFGSALRLFPTRGRRNGTAGKATIAAYREPPGGPPGLTLSLWAAAGSGHNDRLVVRKAPSRRITAGWRLTVGPAWVQFEARDPARVAATVKSGRNPYAAPRGQLNHWVVVFDPKAGKCAAYCNGGKVAEKKSGARSIAPAVEPLTIEVAGQSPATLDELAIWTRPLSEEEVLMLSAGGLGTELDRETTPP